jgi:5-methylcytosine-specific restriction endonuclease McrA
MTPRRKPRTISQVIRIRCNSANYRARKLGVEGVLDAAEVEARCWREGQVCIFCGRKLTPRYCSLDHIVPLSRHGLNEIGNIQFICIKCNRYRGNSTCQEYSEFLQQLGPFQTFFFSHYRPRSYRYGH